MLPPTEAVLEVTHLPICPTLVAIVTLEAVLNPTNDIQPFVDQLLVTEKLMVCMKLNESMTFVLLSIITKLNTSSVVSSADSLCKQFRSRSGPTKCWA